MNFALSRMPSPPRNLRSPPLPPERTGLEAPASLGAGAASEDDDDGDAAQYEARPVEPAATQAPPAPGRSRAVPPGTLVISALPPAYPAARSTPQGPSLLHQQGLAQGAWA